MENNEDKNEMQSSEEVATPAESTEGKVDEKTAEETTENKNTKEEDSEKQKNEETKGQIYVIKVTTNKEDRAVEMISDKIKKKELSVFSLVRPHGLRGYVFLEAADRDTAEEAAYNLPYVKGIIGKTVEYSEIQNMLTPNVEEININEGDVVEIIGEPFKKEKAKVTRVDKQKGEVVVSLLGAVVPIPVTVKIDNVKVVRREDEEEDIVNNTENTQEAKQEEIKPEEPKENLFEDDEFEGPMIGGL